MTEGLAGLVESLVGLFEELAGMFEEQEGRIEGMEGSAGMPSARTASAAPARASSSWLGRQWAPARRALRLTPKLHPNGPSGPSSPRSPPHAASLARPPAAAPARRRRRRAPPCPWAGGTGRRAARR